MFVERLSKEISSYGCEKMIKNVTLFEDLSNDDIRDLVQNLSLQVYLPKDLIIKAGSIGNTMYFLSCGTVAVYTPSGREVRILLFVVRDIGINSSKIFAPFLKF